MPSLPSEQITTKCLANNRGKPESSTPSVYNLLSCSELTYCPTAHGISLLRLGIIKALVYVVQKTESNKSSKIIHQPIQRSPIPPKMALLFSTDQVTHDRHTDVLPIFLSFPIQSCRMRSLKPVDGCNGDPKTKKEIKTTSMRGSNHRPRCVFIVQEPSRGSLLLACGLEQNIGG